MKSSALAPLRLAAQQLSEHMLSATPAEVVTRLGAVQAQDYSQSLWAMGARLPGSTEADMEKAIAERTVVRTWPMRGTLHFVPAPDVRWMLELLTPRIIAGSAGRHRELELTDAVFTKARKVFTSALQGGRQLTREAMMTLLEKKGIPTGGQRGYHVLGRLAQEGLICFASRSGKQPTFALLEEWVPKLVTLDHDAALTTLAHRYFTGHGPATLQDFVWWSGLKVSDARAGLEAASSTLERVEVEGIPHWMRPDISAVPAISSSVHLLPGFDEYLLGYKDRSAVLDPEHGSKIVPGNNGMFMPMLVIGGRVRGTWKRVLRKESCALALTPFAPLRKSETRSALTAAERYGEFLGLPVQVTIDVAGKE